MRFSSALLAVSLSKLVHAQTTTSIPSISAQTQTSSASLSAASTVTSSVTTSGSSSTGAAAASTSTSVLNSTPTSVPSNVTVGLLTTPVQSENLTLSTFNLTTGGNVNYFHSSNVSSAQVLLTASNNTGGNLARFVVATAQGNSGALVYFVPAQNGSNVSVTMDQASLVSTSGDYNQTGTSGLMTVNGQAQLGVAIVGAVRAMRDYVEGSGLMHEIFNYTVGASSNSTYLELNRFPINGSRTYQLAMVAESGSFNITPGNNGTYTPPTVLFVAGNSTASNTTMTGNMTQASNSTMNIRWTFSTNETAVPGLSASSLFLPSNFTSTMMNSTSANSTMSGNSTMSSNSTVSSNSTMNSTYISVDALSAALQGLADGNNTSGNDVSFLTYQTKFTAGGWRFLTYFGRDTLLSVRLLMPLLQSSAIETVFGAAYERINSTGTLCHEETIGDYASFVNIGNNRSDLGDTPFYDYKMIDTDLEALPALAHYFLETPQGQGRAEQFFAQNATLQNGTYGELVLRNVDLVMNISAPFAANATWQNLIALRPGEPVGNWRDSNQGLGYGRYPLDVNTALVPACLRAIASLSSAGILPASYEQNATAYAAVWETQAPPLFAVSIPVDQAQQRLQQYVQAANLSTALLTNPPINATNPLNSTMSSNTTMSSNSTSSAQNVTFQALSLNENGTTVEVMNTDPSFALYYGTNVSESLIQEVVQLLQPYPQGLLTNVGLLVANPAYDSNTTNYEVFSNAAYHGVVIWGWVQAMMAGGVAKQLWYCDNSTTIIDYVTPPQTPPAWCNNTQLVSDLKQAQRNLWTAIDGARDLIFSEVWSQTYNNATNTFTVADLGSLSPEGTESDAIQLWSYGFLAQFDPLTNSTTGSASSNSTSSASGTMTITSSLASATGSQSFGTASGSLASGGGTPTVTLATTAMSTASTNMASMGSSLPTTATMRLGRWA